MCFLVKGATRPFYKLIIVLVRRLHRPGRNIGQEGSNALRYTQKYPLSSLTGKVGLAIGKVAIATPNDKEKAF